MADDSSRTSSRESSSAPTKSLDEMPINQPECSDTEQGLEWELNQFKKGKVPFDNIESHLQSSDPDIRRSVVEAVGMATEHATVESTRAVIHYLTDSNPFVRRACVKSLCAVVVKARKSNV